MLGGHELFKPAADGLDLDPAGDVCGEGVSEQVAGGFEGDAAGTEVEHLFFIDRADRRAVRTFDVVGINLKGRLRINHRIVAQQQRFAGLLGIGLLGIGLTNEDFALEDGGRFPVQHVLVQLVARTVRGGVVEVRVIVHVLIAADQDQAVERGFAADCSAECTFRSLRVIRLPNDAECDTKSAPRSSSTCIVAR